MNLPTKLDIYFKRWGNRSNDCFRIYLYSRVFTICNHEMRPWSIDFWQENRTYKCYWQNQSFDKKIQHSNYRQKIQFLSNPARMSKRNLHVTLCSVLSKTWDNNPPPPPLKAAKQFVAETILQHSPSSEFSLRAARQVSILAEWYGT